MPAENNKLAKHVVESSNLDWVAYDEDKKKLYVQFKSGSYYSYDDVPRNIFEDLLTASSKGRYFWMKIRDKYNYKRIY